MAWFFTTSSLPGENRGYYAATCSTGFYAVSGACGHRDQNSAADEIQLNYNGPDPSNVRTWRCWVRNTSGDSRAIRYGVLCGAGTGENNLSLSSAPPENRAQGVTEKNSEGVIFQSYTELVK